jgi:hypothetical protein
LPGAHVSREQACLCQRNTASNTFIGKQTFMP